MRQQLPLRQILQQFQELTPEEEDLYFEVWCNWCGHRLEEKEYDSHNCVSLQLLKGQLPI